MEFSQIIKASPQTVFAAITTTKGYQGWWAKVCDIDCKIGHVSTVKFLKPGIVEKMSFKTLECKQDEKLVWQCISNNVFETWVDTTLYFDITPIKNNALLKFVHTSHDKNWEKHSDYDNSVAGWHFFINSLKQYCETGKGEPWG